MLVDSEVYCKKALKWTLRTRPMASVPPAPRPAAPEKGLETCVKLDIHTQATEIPWCHRSGHDFWSFPCCALDLHIIGLGHAVALVGYTTAVQPAVLEKYTSWCYNSILIWFMTTYKVWRQETKASCKWICLCLEAECCEIVKVTSDWIILDIQLHKLFHHNISNL